MPPCVESVADRTETHAVVDNNIQGSSKDIQHTPPTDYRMCHLTNCRRRTTNAAVTVTVIVYVWISDGEWSILPFLIDLRR